MWVLACNFFGKKNRGVGVEKMLLGKKILNRRLGGSGIWEENLALRVCFIFYPFKGRKLFLESLDSEKSEEFELKSIPKVDIFK